MNKIKVVDLLNMISKGEEVPRKFTYKGYLWEYDVKNEMWFYYFGNGKNHRFDRLFYLHKILNDEVEIIEEDKKIEKLPKHITDNACASKDFREIANKINEIIEKINEMDKGE